MQDAQHLRTNFNADRAIRWDQGQGRLTHAVITTAQAQAHVYLHGAHVTHFQPDGQKPLLFISAKSWFEPDKPIRGGVPVIFPWFGASTSNPQAPAHGFARTSLWAVEAAKRLGDGRVSLTLSLAPPGSGQKWWPHEFEARYTIVVGESLELALEIRNTSSTHIVFEEALHTYLAVADVRRVSVTGLANREYLDKVDVTKRKRQGPEPIRFEGETDRVYLDTQDTVTLDDPAQDRRISVSKEGSNTTVVWNPWINKARAMADFGDDEWPHMACVEAANAAQNAVQLAPAAFHTLRAIIRVAPAKLA